MHIGIDCRKILNPEAGEVGGVAHHTFWLVDHLLKVGGEHRFTLFFDYRMKDVQMFERPNVTIRHLPYSQYKRYLPFTYSHLLLSAFLGRENLDVFHSPTASLPLAYSAASVVTVHDLAIFHHPEWFPSHFLSRQAFSTKVVVPSSLKAARHIIAVSHFTKRDILQLFHVPEERITVIPEAVVTDDVSGETLGRVRRQLGLTRPYILFLGTIEPRKNLVALIETFVECVERSRDLQPIDLVIAGGRGWNNQHVFLAATTAIHKLKGREAMVHMVGAVSHEQKLALLKGAEFFVWPSLYEGFGLPVLEAMSMGIPVLTSSVTAIPEVVDGAAMLVDPANREQLAAAITSLLGSQERRQRLREEGLKRAQEFSWERTAQETLKVYERVALGA